MIKIIADSTCDLTENLINENDITILPLHIVLGDEQYEDGKNITPEGIFTWSDMNKTTPKTAAASIEEAIDCMKPHLDAGDEIICFSISNEMSATGNVMRLAVEELEAEDRVSVINSANLSTGISLLILQAAKMIKEGKSRQDIVDQIEVLKPLVRSSFVVDTLVYLHRGGRCSGLAALAGGALKLHPKIEVEGGKMKPGKKYRGDISRAISFYVKDLENDLRNAQKENVFITHSGCDPEIVKQVREYLESLEVFDNIYESRAGGVISCHCGPGTLGVLFIAKE